jgi:DNA (cytosine-5)-methyltransferase 1
VIRTVISGPAGENKRNARLPSVFRSLTSEKWAGANPAALWKRRAKSSAEESILPLSDSAKGTESRNTKYFILSRAHLLHSLPVRHSLDDSSRAFLSSQSSQTSFPPKLVEAAHSTEVRPRVADLFSGVGGLSLGAARAGFDVAVAIDLDRHAIASHEKNFPCAQHSRRNISNLTGDALLRIAQLDRENLAGIIGGPPCQGFSTMGRQRKNDSRNRLFFHFFRIISEIEPWFFVAENVPGILTDQHQTLRETALGLLGRNYTVLEPIRLKASEFGAATSRERVFFVGYRKDRFAALRTDDILARKSTDVVKVRDALYGLPVRVWSQWLTEPQSWRCVGDLPLSSFRERIFAGAPAGVGDEDAQTRLLRSREVSGCFGTRHSPALRKRYRNLKPGEKDEATKSVRLKWDEFCPTLRAGTGPDRGRFQAVRPIHPSAPRVITPREAARLQGFPDWFQFDSTKWHSFRQIGNSVSPLLAEAVLAAIRSKIKKAHA